jgi:diamine N-acetyltransferase
MENYTIKKVNIDEVNQLQQIAITTFVSTFGADNNQKDMEDYVADKLAINQLKSELLNPNSQFYFALDNEQVIGYLKVNVKDAQTEAQGNDAMEIERIYVLDAYHGLKVGQLLYNYAIQLASELNVKRIWLGVWEENKRAIKFYEKNGFSVFGQHVFVLGDDKQTDYLMEKILD